MLPPWDLFEPHRGRAFAFFLDRTGDDCWSFAGSEPTRQLIVERDGSCLQREAGFERSVGGDPITAIEAFVEDSAVPNHDELATGLPRTVGYLGYELGALIEGVQVPVFDPVQTPLAVLSTYDRVYGWRPGMEKPLALELAGGGPQRARVDACSPAPRCRSECDGRERPFAHYRRGFERIKTAIVEGEIYQANLSRRMTARFDIDPVDAYRRLRSRQPVPHGAILDYGAWSVLSNSPECFLQVSGNDIRTFPIKGTRARRMSGADGETTTDLSRDPKERAEHLMIVDLERNDLGRVCTVGSVHVPDYARVQSYATVHHLVSEVRGRLRDDVGLAAILRATFPGGSITGAPKIRSMQVIADVEEETRGIYTGAIGCFNGGRRILLNIAIRTAVVASGLIHYRTGGGIVADSVLTAEYEETVAKARAYLDSVLAPEAARAAGIS